METRYWLLMSFLLFLTSHTIAYVYHVHFTKECTHYFLFNSDVFSQTQNINNKTLFYDDSLISNHINTEQRQLIYSDAVKSYIGTSHPIKVLLAVTFDKSYNLFEYNKQCHFHKLFFQLFFH